MTAARRDIPHSESQTLITGVYRSGTEFVTLLAGGHPRLNATMYHVNAIRFVKDRYGPLADATNLDRALTDLAERLETRYAIRFDRAAVSARLAATGRRDWAGLYDAVMSALWLSNDKVHWAEKCQLVWREIPDFIAAMPNGRAIMVMRDPRSVMASFKRYTNAPAPGYLGAAFNCLDALTHARRFGATLAPDRFLLVRYEDAARAPRETAERIFRFLELNPEAACFDRSGWRDAYGAAWRANSAFQDGSEQFDVEAAIGRWRGTLSAAETAFVERVCGSEMAEFGYDVFDARASEAEIRALWRDDPAIETFMRRFERTGEGIQAFPTDPLNPANWDATAEPVN